MYLRCLNTMRPPNDRSAGWKAPGPGESTELAQWRQANREVRNVVKILFEVPGREQSPC